MFYNLAKPIRQQHKHLIILEMKSRLCTETLMHPNQLCERLDTFIRIADIDVEQDPLFAHNRDDAPNSDMEHVPEEWSLFRNMGIDPRTIAKGTARKVNRAGTITPPASTCYNAMHRHHQEFMGKYGLLKMKHELQSDKQTTPLDPGTAARRYIAFIGQSLSRHISACIEMNKHACIDTGHITAPKHYEALTFYARIIFHSSSRSSPAALAMREVIVPPATPFGQPKRYYLSLSYFFSNDLVFLLGHFRHLSLLINPAASYLH